MNKPFKAAPVPASVHPLSRAGTNPIGAAVRDGPAHGQTGEAGAPNLSTPHGKRPRCKTCGRGFYGCICSAPDIEDMPASDVVRIMSDFFPDSGWANAERSAYGMGK